MLVVLVALAMTLTACGGREKISDAELIVLRIDLLQGEPRSGSPPPPWRITLLTGLDRRAPMLAEPGNFEDCGDPDVRNCGDGAAAGRTPILSWGFAGQPTERFAALAPGATVETEATHFSARPMTAEYDEIGVRTAPGAPPALLRTTVLKRCPAKVFKVEGFRSGPTGSGVIAVPRFVSTRWTEARADCLEASDLVVSGGL